MKMPEGRYIRSVLILLAAFLTFGGPTYLLYVLQRLALPTPFLLLVGLVTFIIGVLLFMRLLREEDAGSSSN